MTRMQQLVGAVVMVVVARGEVLDGSPDKHPKLAGGASGWSVELMGGGELVHLEWNAAERTGSGPALPLHCHLRSKEEASKLDEQQAAFIAGQGFSGLIVACISWYDSLESIAEKSGPWKEALEHAQRKGLRDNWISYHMFYKNGHWNPFNPQMPEQPTDWFDDVLWAKIAENLKMAARLAREANTRGLAIDIESYGGPLPTKTWEERAEEAEALARQRGRELASVIVDEFPGAEILVLPAYYIWDGLKEVIGGRRFAKPFALGMAQVLAERQSSDGPGGFYPASEFTYGPVGDMTVERCRGRVDWVLKNLERPMSHFAAKHPTYYQKRVGLAAGVWPLGDYLSDEGGGADDRRYSPTAHRNMLSACRQSGAPIVWVYGQNWAWYNSTWNEYAEVNHRFRDATKYVVYEPTATGEKPCVTTFRLHTRLSSAKSSVGYKVSAVRPSRLGSENGVSIHPQSRAGIADDFSDGLSDRWEVNSTPPGRRPPKPRGEGYLPFILRKSGGFADMSVGLKEPPRTSGTARLTIHSFRHLGDVAAGVGLRLYANEAHWVILEKRAKAFLLRWRTGGEEEKRGVGFDNQGPGGEFGLTWDEGSVSWQVEGIPSNRGTITLKLPPCEVQIYAWANKGATLRTSVDDFILLEGVDA